LWQIYPIATAVPEEVSKNNMMDDEVMRTIQWLINRWMSLDSDWQGLFVGAAILVLINLTHVTVP
jgi:hypothetical protein